jgi:carboxyl-terminal processing protease
MLPASNKGVGMNIGFPDVCLTPAGPVPVPIPYPNIAMNAMAVPFCPTILLSAMPALNMGSVIPMTLGMQPGVANPLYMQMGMYTMGNPTILVQCLPGINLTCPTSGNAMNNPVGAVLVPSVTNVFFADADLAAAASLPNHGEGFGLVDLERTMRESTITARLCGDVGYLRISRFSSAIPASAYSLVRAFERQGATSLVIDLRGNPGGDASAAIELAGDFLRAGELVVTMTDVDGDNSDYLSSANLYALPLTIVIDGRTASAAELFAGALRARHRARIVGARSYGKGEAQAIVASAEGGALYGTVGRFTFSDGTSVEITGIEPDGELRVDLADVLAQF